MQYVVLGLIDVLFRNSHVRCYVLGPCLFGWILVSIRENRMFGVSEITSHKR